MSADFTLKKYTQLLLAFKTNGYHIIPYVDYIKSNPMDKVLILRHDVDKRPENSLATAKIEAELGVTGTYYFRVVSSSFNPHYISQIKDLGHEIGYHYEDLTLCKGDHDKAIEHFQKWLNKFRELATIETICMHGSPMTKWDNREIWNNFEYKSLDILAEPYFDTDFNSVLYITDTGRNWNNIGSVRDHVESKYNFKFDQTESIIQHLNDNKLPDQIMLNIHPQRWTNSNTLWIQEYFLQNAKNIVKQIIKK